MTSWTTSNNTAPIIPVAWPAAGIYVYVVTVKRRKPRLACNQTCEEPVSMLKEMGYHLTDVMSAKCFLSRFEPEVLGLILDLEAALLEDTKRADLIALELGLEINRQGVYPRSIWELVYPSH